MTAIGIAGSPRPNGNSTTLLKAVLAGAASAGARTRMIRLDEFSYRGCRGCERCSPRGVCVVKDALTPVLAALDLADIWVLAAPIYYDGVSGQLKLFFDRCRCFTRKDGELKPQLAGKRRGAVIVTYEDKPREDYHRAARVLGNYMSWMGDFGEVEIVAEGRLGPATAAANRPDLLEQSEALGKQLLKQLREG